MSDAAARPHFSGFRLPESNYFRMPNEWTDITASIDNLAELKVVEYVLRHTWGYSEYHGAKHITVDEFVRGRKRRDGTRMDRGTGLSERAVRYGLDRATTDGLLVVLVDDRDKGRIKKSYALVLAEVHDLHPTADAAVQTLHPSRHDLPVSAAPGAPRTEKDTPDNFPEKDDALTMAWSTALADLAEQIPPGNVARWLSRAALAAAANGTAVVACPDAATATELRRRYDALIRQAVSDALGRAVSVEYRAE